MLQIKKYIILILFFNITGFIAQIKLCEEKTVMYSKCYTLNADGTFTFEGNYCGARQTGKGNYKKTPKYITFVFDSIKPKTIEKQLIGESNKITIQAISLTNGLADKLFTLVYRNHFYDANKEGYITIDYNGGEIEYNSDNNPQSKKINPYLDKANNYIIYTDYLSDLSLSGEIHKFFKKRNKYKYTDYTPVYKEKLGKYIKRKKVYTYIEK